MMFLRTDNNNKKKFFVILKCKFLILINKIFTKENNCFRVVTIFLNFFFSIRKIFTHFPGKIIKKNFARTR